MSFRGKIKELLKDRHQRILFFGLVCSLFTHLVVFLLLNQWQPPQLQEPEVIEFTFQEVEKVMPKAKVDDSKAKQIVQQDDVRMNDEIDKKAKYLGKHNQRVVEETKAANHGKFNNKAAGNPNEKQQAKTHKQTEKKKPKKSSIAKNLKGTMPTFAELKPKFDWDLPQAKGDNPNLKQASSQSDHLKDVKTGAQTLLSTREFVYYSYYSRIKNRLQQHWEPKIKQKMKLIMQKGRKLAAVEGDRITKLIIVLDNKGILQKVKVVGESGESDLDDAAIEAFRAAAPFPNPPKGIIESDGTVKIRWDFVLEA